MVLSPRRCFVSVCLTLTNGGPLRSPPAGRPGGGSGTDLSGRSERTCAQRSVFVYWCILAGAGSSQAVSPGPRVGGVFRLGGSQHRPRGPRWGRAGSVSFKVAPSWADGGGGFLGRDRVHKGPEVGPAWEAAGGGGRRGGGRPVTGEHRASPGPGCWGRGAGHLSPLACARTGRVPIPVEWDTGGTQVARPTGGTQRGPDSVGAGRRVAALDSVPRKMEVSEI